MKICITGIGGFLGSHLADALLAQGHEVVGIDNLIGGYEDNIPDGVEWVRGDCGDLETMTKLLEGVDVVYHTACTAYEGLSVFSPDLVVRNTSGIATTAITASIRAGVKRFIHCSSMARYGTNKTPFIEDMIPAPQDPYGIAKYATELLLRNLAEVHGMEYVIAVPHNIIGARQKYDDPFRNVASIMINRMLQGKQPIIYGDGTQTRCFSFIEDIVDPLIRMIDAPVSGEVINIGPDQGEVTINELAETIAEIINFDLDPIYMTGRPQEVKHANCSADKARKLLGYEPKTSLKDGLMTIVAYIKERGTRPFDYHLPVEIVSDKTPKTWTQKLM